MAQQIPRHQELYKKDFVFVNPAFIGPNLNDLTVLISRSSTCVDTSQKYLKILFEFQTSGNRKRHDSRKGAKTPSDVPSARHPERMRGI